MPGNEHLSFSPEAAWGTYLAPTMAIPVTSTSMGPVQPQMTNEDTGAGRARRPGGLGEKTVTGPIMTKLYGLDEGFLFGGMYGTRLAAAAGTGFRNKMLPDDDIDFESYSFQKRYKDTVAESIRGAKMNGYTVGARSKEFATVELRFIAKDSAMTGGFFADGTTAAPAVVDPVPYPVGQTDPIKFNQGQMYTGGTTALTAGEIVVTGATGRCEFDNVSVEVNNNLSNDAFGICIGDATVQSIDEGARTITLRFEPNFNTVEGEFYNNWLEGDDLVMILFFQGAIYNGANHFEWRWAFPRVRVTSAPNPELNARYGLKRSTVEAMAYFDDVIGSDHGLVIQTTDDLTTI